MTELPSTRRIFCNICSLETNHECIATHQRKFYTAGLLETIGYRLWICAGCETGTLEEFYTNDEKQEYNEEEVSTYYPERSKSHIDEKPFVKLPPKLRIMYHETLQAFNNGLTVLCAIGIRALLEGICTDKGIEGHNLNKKIQAMEEILPSNIVDNLHSIRFIGNTAAHELTAPHRMELQLAIEICHDLLNYLYELDYKTNTLNRTWERKPGMRIRVVWNYPGYYQGKHNVETRERYSKTYS